MAARRHPSSLADLPTKVAIQIAGHLAATSERPTDDLHNLWTTCHFMRGVCRDHAVGQHIALERFAHRMERNDYDGYTIDGPLTDSIIIASTNTIIIATTLTKIIISNKQSIKLDIFYDFIE
jgi:hypothetical protein